MDWPVGNRPSRSDSALAESPLQVDAFRTFRGQLARSMDITYSMVEEFVSSLQADYIHRSAYEKVKKELGNDQTATLQESR